MLGQVKWFDAEKGFGFLISRERPVDIFVHKSAVTRRLDRAALLVEGDQVTFNCEPDPRNAGKLRAQGVTVINTGRGKS